MQDVGRDPGEVPGLHVRRLLEEHGQVTRGPQDSRRQEVERNVLEVLRRQASKSKMGGAVLLVKTQGEGRFSLGAMDLDPFPPAVAPSLLLIKLSCTRASVQGFTDTRTSGTVERFAARDTGLHKGFHKGPQAPLGLFSSSHAF